MEGVQAYSVASYYLVLRKKPSLTRASYYILFCYIHRHH